MEKATKKPIQFKLDIYNVDNTKYTIESKYKPEKITIRNFDSEEDRFVMIEKEINLELEWENEAELLKEITQGGSE